MVDQLESLRREMAARALLPQAEAPTRVRLGGARVLAIASGKGGVGKTNLTVNLATTLAAQNQRVLILDADLGLANVDLLMGIAPTHTLWHAIYGEVPLADIIYRGPNNLQILAGASGVEGLADLPDTQRDTLLQRLGYLEADYDFLLIDCGAGIDHNVLGFTSAADEALLVCTPEPTAVMDVYGLIKMIHRRRPDARISLVMNQVERQAEGQNAAESIREVAKRFLGLDIQTTYYIPKDPAVSQAVRRQRPLVELYPTSPASRAVGKVAEHLMGGRPVQHKLGFFTRVGTMLQSAKV